MVYQAFRTENVLLSLLTEWAKEAGLNDIYILPARKNKWMPTEESITKFPERGGYFLKQRLINRYDGTAKRAGFEKGINGFWHKSLNSKHH